MCTVFFSSCVYVWVLDLYTGKAKENMSSCIYSVYLRMYALTLWCRTKVIEDAREVFS